MTQTQNSKHATAAKILATANRALCKDEKLQVAHDRLMRSGAGCDSEEYGVLWNNYLRAGGSLTMINKTIDPDNWQRATGQEVA